MSWHERGVSDACVVVGIGGKEEMGVVNGWCEARRQGGDGVGEVDGFGTVDVGSEGSVSYAVCSDSG